MKNKNILLFFIFNFLIIFTTHQEVVYELLNEWSSTGPYNHGWLGLSLSIYCLWLKRQALTTVKAGILASLFLIGTLLLLLVADLASLGQLQQLSLFLILIALLTSIYGFTILKLLFLPLMILAFTLPIWNLLQIPLQELSTWVTFNTIKLLNYDIIRENYHLITPGGSFVVEQACSGLGFLLISALYATFVIQINQLSTGSALRFFSIAVVTAIAANWIRIIAIVIIGDKTQMQHFVVQDHLTFGWFVFAICYLPIIFLGSHYTNRSAQHPQKNKKILDATESISPNLRLIFLSLIVIAINYSYFMITARFDPNYQLTLPEVESYKKIGETHLSNPNWFPSYQGASSEQFNYYLQDKSLLQVYVANYAHQKQGKELIYVKNSPFSPTRWPVQEEQKIKVEHNIDAINLFSLRKNNQQSRLIAYWYFIDGQLISGQKEAKWASFKGVLKGVPGASLVAISIDHTYQDQQQAKQIIIDFSLKLINSIKKQV